MFNYQRIKVFFFYLILVSIFFNLEINLFEISGDSRLQLADTTHISEEQNTFNLRSNSTILSAPLYSLIILIMFILTLLDKNIFKKIKKVKPVELKNIMFFSFIVIFLIILTIINSENYTAKQFYLANLRSFKFFEIIILYFFLKTYLSKTKINHDFVVIFLFFLILLNFYSHIFLNISNESRIEIFVPFILALVYISHIKYSYFIFIFEFLFFLILLILSKTTLIFLFLFYLLMRLIINYLYKNKLDIRKILILFISFIIFLVGNTSQSIDKVKNSLLSKESFSYNENVKNSLSVESFDKFLFDLDSNECKKNTFCIRLQKYYDIVSSGNIKFFGSGSYSSVFVHNLTTDNAFLEVIIDFGFICIFFIIILFLLNIKIINIRNNNFQIYIQIISIILLLAFVSNLLYANKIFLTLIILDYYYKSRLKN